MGQGAMVTMGHGAKLRSEQKIGPKFTPEFVIGIMDVPSKQ